MAAELAIVNAKVWTVDPQGGLAEAVAVRGGRIVAVGSTADVRVHIGPGTEVIDAAGRGLLPGFNDAHAHLVSAGANLLAPDFRGAADEGEFVRMLAEHIASLPKGTWVTRGQWDHESWPTRRLPTAGLIDPVSPDHPVFLRRLDGHVGVANSLALKLAGVTRKTPDVPGGRIVRDASTGEPTGPLVDAAAELVRRAIPQPDEAENLAAARAALACAARHGVTSLQTPCSLGEYRLYRRLRDAGELTARLYAILPADEIDTAAAERHAGDELLRTGAVKIFADGSFGAASALLSEPYADEPGSVGVALCEPDRLVELVRAADAAGLQAAVHAIGDEAVHRTLNAFEQVLRAGGRRGARHRIEHAQMIRPADRGRLADLGVIASLQPSHCIDDMRWIERRLGPRCRWAYPYRSLVESGAPIALGTDWDVEPLAPTLGLYAAVTRQFPAGGPTGGWYPAEIVSIRQAVSDYTLGSAYAEFQEGAKGTLRPGKLADMVLLSRDLLSIPAAEILDAAVEMTFLAGRAVFGGPV